MQNQSNPSDAVAKALFNQALVVTVELTKAEAIVDHAFGAAEAAIFAAEQSSQSKLLEIARETLNIARHTASEMLLSAKKEAEEMLRQSNQAIGG